MFLFILFRKPFTEPALNYANLVTEFVFTLIVPLIATFEFDLNGKVRDVIDVVLIVLINIIVVAQMAASLFIFAKTVKIKLRNRKLTQIRNCKEEENQRNFRIQVNPVDLKSDVDNYSFYSNQVYNSPAFSADNSILPEIVYKDEKLMASSSKVVSSFKVLESNVTVEKCEIERQVIRNRASVDSIYLNKDKVYTLEIKM